MPIIDLTQPLVVLLCLAAIILSIILGRETKRAIIPAIALILCIATLVTHTLQLYVFSENYIGYEKVLSTSLLFDYAFVLLTYLSYIWIDDIEAKYRNKKSIDNSLDWFWSKIV